MGAGILSKIAFGLETTYGTAVTPDKALAIHPGDGIQTDNDTQFVTAIKGQIAKNSGSFIGKRKHEGEYEIDFIPGNLGYLLKSVFGSVSSALVDGETTVYNHTFSENTSHPSLTIQQDVGDIIRRYAGCIPTEFTLSGKAGEVLLAKFAIKGKSSASASAVSPANETLEPLNFAHILAASGFKLGGVAYSGLENFEISYKNNGDKVYAMGSNDPYQFIPKGSEVDGKFELYLDATTAAKYTDYINNTEQSLQIVATGPSVGVASNYKIDLTVHKAVFKVAKYPITEDATLLSVEFSGIYSTADSKLLTLILTNTFANYN